jgi:pimeloyl-ACP methyl ester carboxylesterase
MTSAQSVSLFLHGGPGFNSEVERIWFADTLPVLWWDQPAVSAFSELVSAAAAQIDSMSHSSRDGIHLIAHSFGGQIAAALAREFPSKIRSITLLDCPAEPVRPFFLLGDRLLETGGHFPGLAEALAAAKIDIKHFFALVQACYPGEACPDVYFAPQSSAIRERYQSLAAQAKPLDLASFAAVMSALLTTPNPIVEAGFHGEVNILMGRHDPLLDRDTDTRQWLTVFPQAKISMLDAGHGIHFELPSAQWLGIPSID